MAGEGPVGEEGIPQDVITFLNTHTPDKVRVKADEDMPHPEYMWVRLFASSHVA
jgi:hypothetical protein